MRFNRRARLDTSEIRDRRGSPGRGPVAAGAGGLGIIGLILAVLMGAFGGGGGGGGTATGGAGGGLSDILGGQTAGGSSGAADNSQLESTCQTGADANEDEVCLIVGTVNSVQDYWLAEFTASNLEYQPAFTNFFTGSVNTGCGGATEAVGPFDCPADQQVYIELGFFDLLESRFGASGGDFARAYVIAHEYGHHVQNLLGTSAQVQQSGDREGEDSASVRLELQADCYAGVWANEATTSPDPATGQPLIVELTDEDIDEALSAAAAVGDDRIQGSGDRSCRSREAGPTAASEQRQRWFRVGLDSGNPDECDTFNTNNL